MDKPYLLKQGGRVDYNYKEFYVDNVEDIALIKIDEDICPGSTVFVTSTSQVFILNTKKEWVAI